MLVDFFGDFTNKGKLLYGFEEFNDDFLKTEDYKKLLIDFIMNKSKFVDDYNLPDRSSSHIKKEAQKQIISFFGDMDRTIPMVQDNSNLLADFYAEFKEITKDNIDEFIKHLKKSANYDDIFNLPVHLQGGNLRTGQIESIGFRLSDDIDISEFPVLYTCIEMFAYWDDLTISHLVHEMIHGLINRNRGIIKDGMLNETLPIFLELVASLNMDDTKKLLDVGIKYRLLGTKLMMLDSLKDEFTENDTSLAKQYFISTIYAFSLFNNYLKASEIERKDMLNEIKKTLIGERCLEDTLKVLGANEKEGTEIVRYHINRAL